MPTTYADKTNLPFMEMREEITRCLVSQVTEHSAQVKKVFKDEVTQFVPSEALAIEFSERLQHYASLANNKVIETEIDGLTATVITAVKKIIDPLTNDVSDTIAQGGMAVLAQHPVTGEQALFSYNGPKHNAYHRHSLDGDLFTLSADDDTLIRDITSHLKKDPSWALFTKEGVLNSLTGIPDQDTVQKMKVNGFEPGFNSLERRLSDVIDGSYLVQHPALRNQTLSFRGKTLISILEDFHLKKTRGGEGASPSPFALRSNELTNESALMHILLKESVFDRLSSESPKIAAFQQATWQHHLDYVQHIRDKVEQRQLTHTRGLDLNPINTFGSITASVNDILYPETVLNFIQAGTSETIKAYRLEFINKSYTDLYGSLAQAENALSDNHEREFMVGWLSEVIQHAKAGREQVTMANGEVNHIVMPAMLSLIDEGQATGKRGRDRIVQHFGFRKLSAAEFKRAMSMFGHDGILNSRPIGNRKTVFRNSFKSSFQDALSLAKLPVSWLAISKEDPTPYFFEAGRDLLPAHDQIKHGLDRDEFRDKIEKAARLHYIALPFLINAGKAKDEAMFIGDHEKDEDITRKCHFVAKRDKPVMDVLFELDDTHKIDATYRDYPKLLCQLFEAHVLRTLLSCQHTLGDVEEFVSLGFRNSLDIQSRLIDDAVLAHYDNNRDDNPMDNDEGDYDHEHDHHHSDHILDRRPEDFYAPNEEYIKKWLLKDQYGFKEILKLNDQIHKAHSNMIRTLNQFSNSDYSWTPLISEPFTYIDQEGTLTANVINSRLDLFEEGNMMSHCVFSYLSACMSGESIILSLRDEQNERVATIELTREEEDDDGLPLFEVSQCFGHRNNQAPDAAIKAADLLVEKLNNRTLAFDHNITIDEKSQQIFDDAMEYPMSQGDLFSAVPYTTDAAFLVEDLINQYLPKGKDATSYLTEACGSFNYIYKISDFKQDKMLLNELQAKHELNLETLLQIKADFHLRDIRSLPYQINALKAFHQEIEPIRSTLLAQGLTPEQVVNEIMSTVTPPPPLSAITAGRTNLYSKPTSELRSHFQQESLKAYVTSSGDLQDLLEHCPVALLSTTIAPDQPVLQNTKIEPVLAARHRVAR